MKRSTALRQLVVGIVATTSLCGVTAAADASADDRVELRGRCSAGSAWRLRVRAEDRELRIEFRIEPGLRTGLWQVIVLHERRIALRRTLRAPDGGGSLEVRTRVPDWWGTDSIVIRATGPRNEICRASVTV